MNTTDLNQPSANSSTEVQRTLVSYRPFPATATEARGNMGESESQNQCNKGEEFNVLPQGAQGDLVCESKCNYCHITQCLLEDEENKLIELLQYKEKMRVKRRELDREYDKLHYFTSELLRLLKDQKQMDPVLRDTD